jgi:NAD(P)-dependent dehydrogenase (short-subunit alcohol dehydrogenase family)
MEIEFMSVRNVDMHGKICLITGANSGIGKATALGLASMGATVVMVVRDQSKGEAAQKEIKEQSGNANVDLLVADLSSQQAIRQLAEDFKQRYNRLDVLINNAGAILLSRKETVDGLEWTFAVNHLAPFLLTNLLLDILKNSAPSRIVIVGSGAHEIGYIDMNDLQSKKRYRAMRVYGQSKLAVLLFTYELAKRLQGTGVTVNCLHPGFVATNIGQGDVNEFLRKLGNFFVSRLGISPEKGAETSLYLATSPDIEDVSGKYFVKCVPKRSAEISYDQVLQKQLWEESERLVHWGSR